MTEQTFLRGVNAFIEALTDPAASAMGFFSGLLGSIIPTIVSDVARGIDTVERRTEGITGRLQGRIPVLRQQLEPQINVLGETKKIPNILTSMADPSRPSKISTDPVVIELRRLWDSGNKATPTQLGDRAGYDSLTPAQNTDLWEGAGGLLRSKLEKLIRLPAYQAMDDEDKASTIKKFSDESKKQARAQFILQLTQGLSGEDLQSALSKHKESGLLNKEVLKIYEKFRAQAENASIQRL